VAGSAGQRSSILASLRQIVPQFTYPNCEAESKIGHEPSHEKEWETANLPLPPRLPAMQPGLATFAEIPQSTYRSWPAAATELR
jgi:hypothetical protein